MIRAPYAAKACRRCKTRKKRCEVREGGPDGPCRGCTLAKKEMACSLVTGFEEESAEDSVASPGRGRPPSVVSMERRAGAGRAGEGTLSTHSTSAVLTKQLLSYSLVFHLITLHLKHRPTQIEVGLSIIEWTSLGQDIGRVKEKTSELSILEQGVAWLALVDGARITTHSAIIGTNHSPLPEFGSFNTVDSRLSSLGTRRRPAVDQLSNHAITFMEEELLPSFSPKEDEKKLMFLWLFCSLMDSPATRKWCRSAMGSAARLSAGILRRGDLDGETRVRVGTLAFYAVLNEIIRSAHYGLAPITTREDFLSVITVCPDAAPPYTLTPADLDTLFSLSPPIDAVTGIRTALFAPGIINFPRAVYCYFYQDNPSLSPIEIITQMWTFLDFFSASLMGVVGFIETDIRFEERRGERREAIDEVILKALDYVVILASMLCSCHLKLLGLTNLGKARKSFLGSSQARLWELIGNFDRFLRVMSPHSTFYRLDVITVTVQDITRLPENGPCATLSRSDFPSLFEGIQYASFFSMEAVNLVSFLSKNDLGESAAFSDGRDSKSPRSILLSSPSGSEGFLLPKMETPPPMFERETDAKARKMVRRALAAMEVDNL